MIFDFYAFYFITFQNDHDVNELDFQRSTAILAWIIIKIKYAIEVYSKIYYLKCGYKCSEFE